MRILDWHDIAGDRIYDYKTPIPIIRVGKGRIIEVEYRKHFVLFDLTRVTTMIEDRIASKRE